MEQKKYARVFRPSGPDCNEWALSKKDLHRKLGIFILPIVSDRTNVFIVTWLSYAEEELTYSLALAPDWLTKR